MGRSRLFRGLLEDRRIRRSLWSGDLRVSANLANTGAQRSFLFPLPQKQQRPLAADAGSKIRGGAEPVTPGRKGSTSRSRKVSEIKDILEADGLKKSFAIHSAGRKRISLEAQSLMSKILRA